MSAGDTSADNVAGGAVSIAAGQGSSTTGGQGGDGGKDQDPQNGQSAGKSPMSLDDIEKILNGHGEALDPSKAMEQDVNRNKEDLEGKKK